VDRADIPQRAVCDFLSRDFRRRGKGVTAGAAAGDEVSSGRDYAFHLLGVHGDRLLREQVSARSQHRERQFRTRARRQRQRNRVHLRFLNQFHAVRVDFRRADLACELFQPLSYGVGQRGHRRASIPFEPSHMVRPHYAAADHADPDVLHILDSLTRRVE